ncbi:unnamed protein product [Diatraea saccharalis]|uniref:Uncharacterized protein n=1 Tax=Diatraea saccharalis TaxID=40085 RepID=A0A9N9RB43_9NEOP|nr:unnamed protein product [Diatraea saccharalis]
MSSFDDSDYECSYEMCRRGSDSTALPFDPTSLENVILTISDCFDFRVIMSDDRVKGAVLVTTGLALAGGLIGRHYGGKVGAAVGGAIGGACGLGFVAISMRDVWEDIKSKLSELFEIVYDYLAGMGLNDYKQAAMFLAQHSTDTTTLAQVILQTASGLIGKKILSSISNA